MTSQIILVTNQICRRHNSHKPLLSVSTGHIMAACHSLGVVNGKIVGDPLDLEIFNHSDSKLDVPIMKVPKKNIFAAFATSFAANFAAAFTASVGNSKISQLKQFPFSSELARQSVLVKIEQGEGFDSVQVRALRTEIWIRPWIRP